jgi:hypothetical protein
MKRRAAKLKEVAVAIKESTEIVAALNARIDAALAVRDCAQCRIPFIAGYQAVHQRFSLPLSGRFSRGIANNLLPETRKCENWPKEYDLGV